MTLDKAILIHAHTNLISILIYFQALETNHRWLDAIKGKEKYQKYSAQKKKKNDSQKSIVCLQSMQKLFINLQNEHLSVCVYDTFSKDQ